MRKEKRFVRGFLHRHTTTPPPDGELPCGTGPTGERHRAGYGGHGAETVGLRDWDRRTVAVHHPKLFAGASRPGGGEKAAVRSSDHKRAQLAKRLAQVV